MVPECITLEQRQIDKLKRFQDFLIMKVGLDRWLDACAADDTRMSPLRFTVCATGIGDVIQVTGLGYRCDLCIGDDNELSPDDFIEV